MSDQRLSDEFYHLLYDPAAYGFPDYFFKTISGTPVVMGALVVVNTAEFQTLEEYYLGSFEFRLRTPAAPAGGDNRLWGLSSTGVTGYGAAFNISDTTFQTITAGGPGTTPQIVVIPWDDAEWTTQDVTFKIIWAIDKVQFFANDRLLSTHLQNSSNTVTIPRNVALPLRVLNGNADNLSLEYIKISGVHKRIFMNNAVNFNINTLTVPSEFSAHASITDGEATPNTTRVGADLMGFNGTTWDRLRSNTNKILEVSGGSSSVAKSAAKEASHVVKASAGVFYGGIYRVDSALANGTYYIQFLNASSLPADGAVTQLINPIKVAHTSGTDDLYDLDLSLTGITASTGIVVALSTTEFTLTISSANLVTTTFYA